MAEVLLVIWTQWSRKPSDREISVSVSERANGKRQQENEKRAAVPGLRLEMESRKRIESPAVTVLFFLPPPRRNRVFVCAHVLYWVVCRAVVFPP